jgi:hypothetical protein
MPDGRCGNVPITSTRPRWPPALEAVQAAKEQGLDASEGLDRALRIAFFARSRPISLRHEILAAAKEVDGLDADRLAEALDEGRYRSVISEHWEVAASNKVQGSPHLFLPDGTNVHNPGIEMHWEGEHGEGFPVVDGGRPLRLRGPVAAGGKLASERLAFEGGGHHG